MKRNCSERAAVRATGETTTPARTALQVDQNKAAQDDEADWIQPQVQSGLTVQAFSGEGPDLGRLTAALEANINATAGGDTSLTERTLAAQMLTLDFIFHRLAARAASNIGQNSEIVERYLRLALKAQSQSRTTAESLVAIQHPSATTYVRQANIGHAVQVNNGVEPAPSGTKNTKPENEQLEVIDAEWLDPGAPGTAGQRDQAVEAVGKVDRAKNRRREGSLRAER